MKFCKQEEKERREDVHPGLGGDLNLDLPEWQPSVLTTTPFIRIVVLNIKFSR